MSDEQNPDFEDEPSDDAAEAFGILAREVREMGAQLTIIRKGTEAAFDKLDTLQAPPDYTADIAGLGETVEALTEAMRDFAKLPAIRNSPEHFAQVLERGGESLVKTAAHALETNARELDRVSTHLGKRLAGERMRYAQNRLLWIAGSAGLVAGVVLTLFLPAFLPFSAAPRVASVVMGERPWNAGMALMEFDSAETWWRVAGAAQLMEANSEAVAACQEAATSSGEAQSCTITVAPAR